MDKMNNSKTKNSSHKKKWYEKYLPFVARSPEMQIEWLGSVFKKGLLTNEEITPYIRLVLTDIESDAERREHLADLFNCLDEKVLEKFFVAAEIYDTPKLFSLIWRPTIQQAVIVLRKRLPPYEKTPQLVLDKVFQAIYGKSSELFEDAAEVLRKSNDVPEHFESAYKRFQEIVEDEKLLSALYPKAKN